ncbi:hypothetical protein FQN51_008944 [Onygenales sp. PD_10]|nr:hypothetical protein FQN51_008944 [Onygenales sp. PD_10]
MLPLLGVVINQFGFIFSTGPPAHPPTSSTLHPQHGGKDLATLNQFSPSKCHKSSKGKNNHCAHKNLTDCNPEENENCDLNDISSQYFQKVMDKLA